VRRQHTGVMQNCWFRWGLKLVDTVAVDPLRPIGMKTVLKALKSGRPVVIFPEGRISNTGGLMKVYDGSAMLATLSGAELIPVRLDGLKRSYFSRMSSEQPKSWLPKVTLTLLPATRIDSFKTPRVSPKAWCGRIARLWPTWRKFNPCLI